MTIEPEIIPPSSSEGINALNLNNNWKIYFLILTFAFISIFVLKLLIESFLICLGLIFIWKLARS